MEAPEYLEGAPQPKLLHLDPSWHKSVEESLVVRGKFLHNGARWHIRAAAVVCPALHTSERQ